MSDKLNPNTLRTEAVVQLIHALATDAGNRTAEELLHELQVHQIELEMQNDELRRVHVALEEARDRYIDLYDYAPVGYLLLSRDGLLEEINLTASKLLRESRRKLLNRHRRFAAFVIPTDADRWHLFFSGVMKHKERKSIELTLRRCDDTEFPVQLDCLCVDSMLRITLTDITEIKKAEEALREVETHKLAIALASAEMGSWDWDIKTGHVIFNERWAKIRGYQLKDIKPHVSTLENGIHPEDFPAYHAALVAHLENQTPFFQAEYRVRTRSGSLLWVMNRGTVIKRNLEGSPLRMAAIEMDITERWHREQQDKEHLNELAHVTRLGLMGEMASGIAHEVNQPLSAITTYTEVSLNLIKTENPDLVKLADILSKTQEQAVRAGRIIHNMREFVKSQAKLRSIVDINTLIQDAISLCVDELNQNNIRLTCEFENNLPPIHVDPIQIEQVIMNLIRNSIDALQSLSIEQNRQLAIQSQLVHNNYILIRVKDNGAGISQDQQQKILTPFYTTKEDGMGMGLSISRSLIEAHNGAFYFNSEQGKGTAFYFTLPIEKEKSDER
jgi:PAS domain S-box-containing protein